MGKCAATGSRPPPPHTWDRDSAPEARARTRARVRGCSSDDDSYVSHHPVLMTHQLLTSVPAVAACAWFRCRCCSCYSQGAGLQPQPHPWSAAGAGRDLTRGGVTSILLCNTQTHTRHATHDMCMCMCTHTHTHKHTHTQSMTHARTHMCTTLRHNSQPFRLPIIQKKTL